ncbi:MAG: KpsF/GutQ family sugar-phosphate isomerase [Gemmatimonadetes bacterium]|nr:KpsF/GutQ family sugar-phosphate isomerase [Gemmatimonadota bacterium]
MAAEALTAAATTRLDDRELLARARAVVRAEAEGLLALADRLGDGFLEAVRLIGDARGRVVVSGVGKSGIIGRKIAATLTSTGTPATFLHPVEGLHGDLGIVSGDDVAILISKSGESEELGALLGYLARLGVPVVAMTGRPGSSLARAARVVLDCAVAQEACPFDLAPTTSTTVTAALGDALAVALLLRKGFTREDFARLHPGGALGRKLTLRVADLMLTDDIPWLGVGATMRECVVLLAKKRGTVPILDEERRVVGVVTAGDLTRLMEREADFMAVPVEAVMNRSPKLCEATLLAAAAVHQMETFGIMALPVVDADRRLIGIVHLHDLLRAGAV